MHDSHNNPTLQQDKKSSFDLKRIVKMPHTFVLLVILVLLGSALTYMIPAGELDRVEDRVTGKKLVVEGSYHLVSENPVAVTDIPLAIVRGLIDASDIIFSILIVGGAFQVIMATGTVDAATGRVAKKFSKNGKWVIPIFLTLFSIGGFTMGMATEGIVFVPIGIAIARSLGYDAITGTAMIALGASCGFTAGLLNPFTVGIAQAIAGVPLFSGMWLRAILLVVFLVVTSLYVIRYATKVKADPSKSVVYDLENKSAEKKIDFSHIPPLELKHYLTILTMIVCFSLLVWGVSVKNWGIEEISALFLTMGVAAGLSGGFGPNKIASEFTKGAVAITFGALIVGVARGIVVVLEQGNIIDTIVNSLAMVVGELPGSLQVLGMYAFQTVMNVVITSGSGIAATTMPIMAPLSDLLGISRQTAVLAYQLGDGISNLILPVSATLMGTLAVAGISYQKWVKFMWPLMLIWMATGAVFLLIANAVHY